MNVDLKQVETYAVGQLRRDQVALVMGFPERYFRDFEEVERAYTVGQLKAQADINLNTFSLAQAGNPGMIGKYYEIMKANRDLHVGKVREKAVVVLRGLRGVGKSSVAEILSVCGGTVLDAGSYERLRSETDKAPWEWLRDEVKRAVVDGVPLVVAVGIFREATEVEELRRIAEGKGFLFHSLVVEDRHREECEDEERWAELDGFDVHLLAGVDRCALLSAQIEQELCDVCTEKLFGEE